MDANLFLAGLETTCGELGHVFVPIKSRRIFFAALISGRFVRTLKVISHASWRYKAQTAPPASHTAFKLDFASLIAGLPFSLGAQERLSPSLSILTSPVNFLETDLLILGLNILAN